MCFIILCQVLFRSDDKYMELIIIALFDSSVTTQEVPITLSGHSNKIDNHNLVTGVARYDRSSYLLMMSVCDRS